MLIPTKNIKAILSYLFKEGVLVARKDHTLDKHENIEVPNLHVVKLLQSLKSKNLVKEQFNWSRFYWTLTDEGIEYLRKYLHVTNDTVPATLKKPSKPQPPASFGRRDDGEGGRGGFRGRGRGRGRGGGRDGYRSDRPGGDFEGGFGGRGRGGFRGRGRGRGGRGGFGRGEADGAPAGEGAAAEASTAASTAASAQ